MATFNPNWDSSWTTTSINATTITDTTNVTTSSAISNDNKAVTEVSVSVAYGTTADQGVTVYVLRDTDGTNFESVAHDLPWGFSMPYYVSTTCRRCFSIPGNSISKFKVYLDNHSGADVTATVDYKQATIDQT